jgi:predicted ferric reductase
MNRLIKDRANYLLIILFAIIPLVLWLMGDGKQLDFSDFYFSVTTLAKAFGILGICFFASNLILSGRYKFLDRLFGGLDRVYRIHRLGGYYTLSFLTFHALGMHLRMLQFSFTEMINFLFFFSDKSLNYGRISYLGLIVIVGITLFMSGKMKYEWLKGVHKLLGVFLFFGGMHAYFIPSDISQNLLLRNYTLALVGIALLSYLWRSVLQRLLFHKVRLAVLEVNRLSREVTEVVMKPLFPISYYPGQFVFIQFMQKDFPYQDHPFSLTASTKEGLLRISAKALGDFTSNLSNLKPGAIAEIQGPFGGFTFLKTSNKKQVWIAGGIGVTPFVSMARTLRDSADDPRYQDLDITLIYSAHKETDLVYLEELKGIESLSSGLKLVSWVGEQKGYITASDIQEVIALENKDIFICGPPGMMTALRKQLKVLGVPSSKIHFEKFSLL